MTNGEKIQTILDIDKDCTEVYGKNGMMVFSVLQDWWNAEYKELCEDWYDVPSNEMTLEQARQAVKDLRKKLVEYLEQEPRKGHWIDTNDNGFVYHRIYKCSHCGATVCEYPENMHESKYKYCSNCGCRNEVEE